MDLKEIRNLIKFVAKSGVREVALKTADFKIRIKTTSEREPQTTMQPFPAQSAQPAIPQRAPDAEAQQTRQVEGVGETVGKQANTELITVKSPMIGTFYRRPSPDRDAFVKVGGEIGPGDVLCVIEAMKLFNEIESEVSGKIVEVLAADKSPVEYGQPLFLIDPSNV